MYKIYAEEGIIHIVKDILNSLQKQFQKKGERFVFDDVLINDKSKLDQANIYVGSIDETMINQLINKKLIVIFENKFDPNLFQYFLTHEIVGVFRKDRLEIEYEEKGKLEKLLKDLIREGEYNVVSQSDGKYIQHIPYKEITNWKFHIDIKNPVEVYQKSKYISIFLDPTMRQFSRKLRRIINDFKDTFDKYLNNKDSKLEEKECRKSTKQKNLKELEKDLNQCKEKLSKDMGTIKLPSLLIEGETGTGKSLIAEMIAYEVFGEDYIQDFYRKYSINNVSKELIETSLFGHEKGAYTGGETERLGYLIESRFGILFLDEIAEVPPDVQAKLLVYMDDYMVKPMGYSGLGIFAPVMLIAATNKNLKHEIELGNFRMDLYHRFKYKIEIPPLRERKEDIRFLINFVLLNPLVNPFSKENGYAINKISLEAIEILENYHYPGNFRELEGILKQAVNLAMTDGLDIILPKHLLYA